MIDTYIAQGDCQKAIETSRNILSIDPEAQSSLIYAGDAELSCGSKERAKSYYQAGVATVPVPRAVVLLGYVLWKEGEKQEAKKLFDQSLTAVHKRIEEGNEDWRARYAIARIHSVQGDKAEAYKWLQEAIDAGWLAYIRAQKDPLLENLHGEERFEQMMSQVKAKVDGMRKHAEQE